MLQIDHMIEFYPLLFKERFQIHAFLKGTIADANYKLFIDDANDCQILFYDQEPLVPGLTEDYLDFFKLPFTDLPSVEFMKSRPALYDDFYTEDNMAILKAKYNDLHILVTSEHSEFRNYCVERWNLKHMYYFYHAFAAFDWYRGFNVLNCTKQVIKPYAYDFVTFNRLVCNDRSYRLRFISKLVELGLLDKGRISFGVEKEYGTWRDELADPKSKLSPSAKKHALKYLSQIKQPLIIDQEDVPGYASADIPRIINDSLWHVVTETVFYYDKLHLTEKIFKPIVMKQPFMLLAAPGNLAYLRSYGFKTFDGIIDESYDNIQDPDERVDAVVAQLAWYCNLPVEEKQRVIEHLAPIVEYNFHHFYGEFKHIVTDEFLTNCQKLYKEIGYDDSDIAYDDIYKVLTR